jgi:hypothetical protein
MGVNRTRTMLYFSYVDVNIKLFIWRDLDMIEAHAARLALAT